MKKSKMASVLLSALLPFSVLAKGALENPAKSIISSGIGIVSGWHCTAKEVKVNIDGIDLGTSGVGSVRHDTKAACGDVNNGFSLLFNYNDLTPGKHTINVYADGALMETRVFSTVRSSGDVPYREGNYAPVQATNTPMNDQGAQLEWRNEKQNFVITKVYPLNADQLSGEYTLETVNYVIAQTGESPSYQGNNFASGTLSIKNGFYTEKLLEKDGTRTSFSSAIEDSGSYITFNDLKLKNGQKMKHLVIERGDYFTFSQTGCFKTFCYVYTKRWKKVK